MLAGCFEQRIPASIEEKTKLLLENGIALWDILAACEITGSDDSSIRNPVYNDIATFINGKAIAKILCNGKKAYDFCRNIDIAIPIIYLPSTSPANAAWSIERLIDAWKPELVFA